MCGRYGRRGSADKQKLAEEFRAKTDLPDFFFAPNYNIAPSSIQPVVVFNQETAEREITAMRWGLMPAFFKSFKDQYKYRTINARSDKLMVSNMWKESFLHRRCLVPMQFFYEWEDHDGKSGPPHAVSFRDSRIFAVGGFWNRWKDPATSEYHDTFTFVTVDPNPLLEPFHNRCPLVLPPERYHEWLTADPDRPPLHLIETPDDSEWMEWKCNPKVGNYKNNGPEMLDPPQDAAALTLEF